MVQWGEGEQAKSITKSPYLDELVAIYVLFAGISTNFKFPISYYHEPNEITVKTILEGFIGLQAIFLLGCDSFRAKFTLFYVRPNSKISHEKQIASCISAFIKAPTHLIEVLRQQLPRGSD